MAKAPEIKITPEVDALPDMPLPRERTRLIGHREIERELLDAYRSERLHHAWILGGPKGIGKATLAFRFSRFAIANPDRFGPAVAQAQDLGLPVDHPVVRQVASGANPNILHLRRPWDEKGKRFKSELPVDVIRKTISFFGTTASGSAWRICIVDAADDMNISSANALLKVLEEPPSQCLFLVLSHAPGRLLPTIRSRCRRLDLSPLSGDEIAEGLNDLCPDDLPDAAGMHDLVGFADGSLRSALTLLSGDGLAINKGFVKLAEQAPNVDLIALHGLGDLVAARGKTDNWESFLHIARQWLHGRMKSEASGGPERLVSWADMWEKMNRAAADVDALNLDRKQVVLDVFRNLSNIMRMPA
ncbi:DNA polymerase III subunit delta' [Roseibium algae]|uniref:DNA polymerase III subunit delta n=1 Tax=Roseibium algae TaxID=3123038 RepID=A0ABU8TRT4_9HYPH